MNTGHLAPPSYADINVLRQDLVAVYLHGLLVVGDFDPESSDLDAGQWAARAFPEDATTIQDALKYRRPAAESHADYNAHLPDIRRFYDFAARLQTGCLQKNE